MPHKRTSIPPFGRGMEPMEDRWVLTPMAILASVVDVRVTAGDLILTGNSAPNAVDMYQTAPGSFRLDGWRWQGQQTYLRYNNRLYLSLTMSGVTDDVLIDLNSGRDAVWFGDSYQTSAVPDDLNIFTDDGNDVVSLINLSADDLLIDTGNHADTIYVGNVTVGIPGILSTSDATINAGNDSDAVTISYSEFGRDVTLNMGTDSGHDTVTLLGLVVHDDLSIGMNGGMDRATVDSSTIVDALTIDTGADDDQVQLLLTTADDLLASLGAGNDLLALELMAIRLATLYGGTGTDELDVLDSAIGSATLSGFEL